MSTRQYKNLKHLSKENLRDNMTTTELVLNMLAEASTTDISNVEGPQDFSESLNIAKKGGEVAGIARKALEKRTGKAVVTSDNNRQVNTSVKEIVEKLFEEEEE